MVLAAAIALIFVLVFRSKHAKAFPRHQPSPYFPPWHPAGPSDARSPCPGLNALANHNLLPHHGRNITLPILKEGVRAGFNMDAHVPPNATTFADVLFSLAVTTNPAPNATSFDLDKVGRHNFPIEQDGSLSRKDAFFGNFTRFDPPTFGRTWAAFEREGFVNDTFIDIPQAAIVRAKRVLQKSQLGNPEYFFTPEILQRSLGATALYMLVLGGQSELVNKDWVRTLFEEERLPYKEGFKPRTDDVSLVALGTLTKKVLDATPEDIPCSFDPEASCPRGGPAPRMMHV